MIHGVFIIIGKVVIYDRLDWLRIIRIGLFVELRGDMVGPSAGVSVAL